MDQENVVPQMKALCYITASGSALQTHSASEFTAVQRWDFYEKFRKINDHVLILTPLL